MKWTNRLIITLCYSYGFFLNSHASVYNKEMLGENWTTDRSLWYKMSSDPATDCKIQMQ